MLDAHQEEKDAFAALWHRETVTRSSKTFDGAAPNHDGVVVTWTAKPSKTRSPSAAKTRRPSVTITVVMGGKL